MSPTVVSRLGPRVRKQMALLEPVGLCFLDLHYSFPGFAAL